LSVAAQAAAASLAAAFSLLILFLSVRRQPPGKLLLPWQLLAPSLPAQQTSQAGNTLINKLLHRAKYISFSLPQSPAGC